MLTKFKNIALATAMTSLLGSCGTDFLKLDPFQQVDDQKAIVNPGDIKTALNGVYYRLGAAQYGGRTFIALGDMAADNAEHSFATNHLTSLYAYNYNENDIYLDGVWEYAYKVVNNASRVIVAGEKMLDGATSSDSITIRKGLAEAYGLRAYATFTIANLFALPYHADNYNELGAVLGHDPIPALTKVSRATVKETYDYLLEQLQAASTHANGINFGESRAFYMNSAAIAALEARVRLYMGDFTNAKIYAQQAITLRAGTMVTTESDYNAMWDKLSGSSEDIFVIAKAADDNLAANSINTLYSNYGVSIAPSLRALYADGDIRKPRMTAFNGNIYAGGKYKEVITNIPVIRLPELYLIIAECELEASNTVAAANALLEVAKRNKAITSVAELPTTASALRLFIAEERRRELFQEGHRLFDARRTGETIYPESGYLQLNNGLSLFPIPNSEINAGFGVVQNLNWNNYLPTVANR